MIALLLGNVQQQPSQIAYIVPDRLIEIALQQARIVGYVKLIQRLHQMLLTQLRRGQTHHQRFSRKALLEQLLREKTKKFIYWIIIGNRIEFPLTYLHASKIIITRNKPLVIMTQVTRSATRH